MYWTELESLQPKYHAYGGKENLKDNFKVKNFQGITR